MKIWSSLDQNSQYNWTFAADLGGFWSTLNQIKADGYGILDQYEYMNKEQIYPDLTERCAKLPKTEQNNARVVIHLCEQSKLVVELMEATGYESRTSFHRKILTPLLEAGLLKPVLGDKNSPKQRYILQDSALMSGKIYSISGNAWGKDSNHFFLAYAMEYYGMKDWQRDQLLTVEEMKALWEWCDRLYPTKNQPS